MNDSRLRPFLAVDIGNSRTKFGVFAVSEITNPGQLPACIASFAVPHGDEVPWQSLQEAVVGISDVLPRTVVAGVNPRGLETLLTHWRQTGWPAPEIISTYTDLPLRIELEAPERVGMDRLLTAVAGNVLRPTGRPLVVIDSGTATTVDLVSSSGAFRGGTILPGFELAARSLHHYTALLPLIGLDELPPEGPPPLGRSTREAIESGVFWGQVGAVKELLRRLSAGLDAEPLVLLTGGAGARLTPHLDLEHQWLPQLALQGLVLAARAHGEANA